MFELDLMPDFNKALASISTTTATASCGAGNNGIMDGVTMSFLITSNVDMSQIAPVILGTELPGVTIAYLPEQNSTQLSAVEDLAPSLSIAEAAQIAKNAVSNIPGNMIDLDLGPGL